jgi:hypothetical protein
VGPTFALELKPWGGKRMIEWGRTRSIFLRHRSRLEDVDRAFEMGWTQKRILVLWVEFRFCFIALFTTLHCTLHGWGGREAALFCCYSKDGFPFSLAGVMDGLSNMVGGWVNVGS